MGKRVRPTGSHSFPEEVQRQFGALAQEWEMAGPEEGGVVLPTVKYRAGPLTYTWMLDDEDQALAVTAALRVPGGVRSAFLHDLAPGAGLCAPQDVRTSAQTRLALEQAIASHVDWLRRMHSRLTGPDAEEFLARAGTPLVPGDG